MDRYQVSEGPNGPWLELEITNVPQAALTKARASFGWKVVWVAKMRPLKGEDLMPDPEMFFAEMMERMADKHGGQVVDQLTDEIGSTIYDIHHTLSHQLTGCLLDAESEVMVPAIKKPYGRDQSVRATDFLPPKPKLGDLL